MPTLFISYKRGTAAVAPLMERLQAAHYRLWFDREEIHLGDADWQARIDQGLQRCDGVILNITPAACASEPVRYEVRRARELGKPIFPIVLERISSYDDAIRDLGLPEKAHIEDFTDVTRWDEQIERLLRDLQTHGLRVTRHERRQQRDRDNPAYVLHQHYLRRLVERVGTLNLAQIQAAGAAGINLEDVYVDSPSHLSLSVNMDEWCVIDWGLKHTRTFFVTQNPEDQERANAPKKPESLGFDTESLSALIGLIDSRVANYRERYPKAQPDDDYNYWGNGWRSDVFELHLNHLAAACDRLVILGAPGSGKSTFVRYLALCLAGSGIDGWTRSARIEALDNWPHGALTPVYVELRRFVASPHFPPGIHEPVTADHLWRYILAEVLGDELRAYADELRYDLEHGHALLILDGLDEVPYPEGHLRARQAQLVALAQSLQARWARTRVLVASRPYAYEGWKLPGFEVITIRAFMDQHRIALAARLYQAAGLGADEAQQKAEALNDQLGSIDPKLKDRPLFVTLMANLYLKDASEGLPTRRGALYRKSIMLLLDRWTTSKPDAPSLQELLGAASLDDLYARLAQLAYEVHSAYGEQKGEPEIPAMLLESHLMKLGRKSGADPVKLYAYLSENAGVLVSPGQDGEKDVFHFAHRSFQEYLAAAHLITRCAEADSFALVRERIMSKPQVWRVPCVLAGDVLADTGRRANLWGLIGTLLEDDPPEMGADERWWCLWLAAEISIEQKLHEQQKLNRLTEQPIRDALIDWLVRLIETPQALPPAERALCGRALSLLDDPRPGVGVMPSPLAPLPQGEGKRGRGLRGEGLLLPQIEWCDIAPPPNGSFIMGADNQSDNPWREVELKHSFKMAKYLITFQQFQTFVDSGEYDQPDWWIGFPPDYQQQEMAKQVNPYANHPRDSVSWYQAVAFTRWLTVKYREAGLLPPLPAQRLGEGQGVRAEIRLPTEPEWEYAARGTDERTYPWGDAWDAAKCNNGETGIGQTSAVGLFPDGASPFGVLDMSGNVFEWCLNDYQNPESVDGYSNGERKVLRGGSFNFVQFSAACAVRANYSPHIDGSPYGFRVVVAPPISAL